MLARGLEIESPPEPFTLGYSPVANAAIERAAAEARQRNQSPVGTGHLLLAILSVANSHVPELLQRLGVSLDAIRATLEPRLSSGDAA